MSEVVEDKVVQLEFNNANFEKNVNQSIKTVEKLKDSLQIGSSTTAVLTNAVKNIDLSGLVYKVDAIADRFSTFGIVGMTAIQRITNAAIDLGLTIERRITGVLGAAWNQIITGGTSRATNIEKATFQLKGIFGEAEEGQIKLQLAMTGTADQIKEITGLTEDLIVAENAANYAVADTAYGLDSAAKAASVLATSGVDVIRFQEELADESGRARTEMQVALRAISGTAAMANTSYDEMAHIYERISGQNRVMGEDLNSLSTRGLNAAAVLASYLNEVGITANATQADIKKMCSKGEIDFMTFAKAMDKAYGEHAKDANSTFSGAFDNMRFALSKIGADFIAPLRDDMIPVLNNVRMAINAVRSSLTPFVNAWKASSHFITDKLVERFGKLIGAGQTDSEWKGSDQWVNAISNITNVVQIATDILQNFLNLVGSIVQPISSAWKEIFPSKGYEGFVNLLTRIKEFIANSVLSTEAMSKLNRTAKGFFSIFRIALQVISPVVSGILRMVRSLGWLKDILTDSAASFGDRITEIAESNIVFDTVSRIVDKVATSFENLTNSLRRIIPNIRNLASNFVEKFISIKNILADKIKTPSLDSINLSMDGIYSKVEKIEEFFRKFKDTAIAIFTKIFTVIKALAGNIVDKIKTLFSDIASIFTNMPGYLKFENAFDTSATITFIAVIGLIFDRINKLRNKYGSLFNGESLIGQFVDLLASAKKSIENIPAIITNIKKTFNDLSELLKQRKQIEMFKALALVLAVFVASVYVLSKIDAEAAMGGITAVALIIWYLQRTMNSIASTNWNSANLIGARKAIESLVLLSFATLILAGAVSTVAKAFGDSPYGALVGLVSIYVMIEMLMRAMDRIFNIASALVLTSGSSKVIKSIGFVMIELAVAVRIMAGAIKTITKAFDKNPAGAIVAIITIAGFMEQMVRVLERISKYTYSSGMAKAGFAMMEIGAALALMAVAVKIASTAFKSDDMTPGIMGAIVIAGLMELMVRELNRLSNSVGKGASGIFGIQAAATAMVGVAIALAIVGTTIAGLAIAYSKDPVATLSSAGTVMIMLIGITEVLKRFNPESAIGNAFALIEVAIAISMIGRAITRVSKAFSNDPIASITAVGAVLSLLVAMCISLETLNPDKARDNAVSMIAFAAALYLISASVAKIGNLGLQGALTGLGGLIAILLAIAGFAYLAQTGPVAAGLAVITTSIIAFGAAILLAGAGFALFGIGLINIAAGIAALATAWAVSGPMIVQGIVGTLSAIAMAIPTVAAALANGLLVFIEVLLDHVDILINLVRTIVTSTINTISEMVPMIARVIVSLLMFVLDIVANNIGPLVDKLANIIVNLVTALGSRIPDILGAIETLLVPLFNGLVSLVSNLLGIAAEGIGYILGSLVGGIIKGVERALRNVSFVEFATELSDFMLALEPFIDGLNGLNRDSMEAAMMLAGVITILTANAIIDGLTSWFTGGNSLEDFGRQLATFGPYIKRYSNSVKGINVVAVQASTYAASMCAEFARTIPNEGGLISKITGDNDIETFGKKLAAFAPYLKYYADEVRDIDVDAVAASSCAALMLAAFASNIPNEGGLVSKITGDNDIETFGQHLEKFGVYIANYAEEVKGIDSKAVETSVNAARMLTEFAATIPNGTSGLSAFTLGGIFASDNSIEDFGEELSLFGASINDYYNSIKEVNTEAISSINAALLDLFSVLGVANNVTADSIVNLRDILESLAYAGLDGYFEAITSGSTEKLRDSIYTFARNVINYFNEESENINNNTYFRGQDFTKGFADGIKEESSIELVRSAAAEVGEAATEALCDSIGDPPGDPATEEEPVGYSFDLGLSSGIENHSDIPVNAAAALGNSITNTLIANTAGSYDAGYSLVTNLNNGIKDATNNSPKRSPILQHPGYYNPNAITPTYDELPDKLPEINRAYATIIQCQEEAVKSTTALDNAQDYLGDSMFNYTRAVEDEKDSAVDLNSTYEDMASAAEEAAKSANSLSSATNKTGGSAKKASTEVDKLTKKIKDLMSKYEDLFDDAKERANKDLFKGVDDQGDVFLDSIKDIMKQYEDIYKTAVERTNGQDLFAEVSVEDESFAPETLLRNLEDQVGQINELNTIISSLSGRIVDENLRAAIANMDVDKLPELRAMYRMTSDQLNDYERMYQEKVASNQNKIQNELTGSLSQLTGEYTNIASYIADDASSNQLIANLQAQIDQLDIYNNTVASLMNRITDMNLREAIANMGVEALPELERLNTMSDEMLTQYQAMYNQKIASEATALKQELSSQLSAALGEPIDIDAFYAAYKVSMAGLKDSIASDDATTEAGKTAGETLANGMSSGISDSSSAKTAGITYANDIADGLADKDALARVEANAKLIVDKIINIFTEAYGDFKDIGVNLIDRICAGIDAGQRGYGFTTTFNNLVYGINYTLTAGSNYQWLTIGEQITKGIGRGIMSETAVANVEAAARTVAIKATRAAREELGIYSPSRVFAQIGRYMDEGLAMGLRNYSSFAEDASSDMATGTLSPVQEAIQQLSGMLDGSIDINPVITPTLDLSQINARSAALANMFNGRQIAVQARADEQQAEMMTQLGNILAEQNSEPRTVTFNQTNNSPKALSRTEIYRQTRNGFSQLVSALS